MSSILKVDTIQDQSGNNIINESADTITIGASGDTVTIPSGATISNLGTATGFGKVLQVVQGTSTTSTSTTSIAYVTANLSATITPSSASNKILIMLHGCCDTEASGRQWYLGIFRGATNLSGGTALAFDSSYNGAGRQINTTALTHLDSPSTTSSTTYTLHINSPSGNDVEFCSQGTEARIVLMEIAG
jgi:hypothetical protein